jgi:hypothetical protein
MCRYRTGSGPGSVCGAGTRPAPHGCAGGRPRTRHLSTAEVPNGPDHRQLPEAASAGEPAAEGPVADHGRVALLASIAVAVQEPGPHVTGRPEQPVAAVGLGGGGPQADAGGAVQHLRIGRAGGHLELMFACGRGPVKAGWRLCGRASLGRPRSGRTNQSQSKHCLQRHKPRRPGGGVRAAGGSHCPGAGRGVSGHAECYWPWRLTERARRALWLAALFWWMTPLLAARS